MSRRKSRRERGAEPQVMVDINTTPLIDVMLVLLIMLIITIPIQLHAVNLNTPVGTSPPPSQPPEVVRVDIDASSHVYWQGTLVDAGQLEHAMQAEAAKAVQPEVHLRPHRKAKYKVVAGVLASAQRLGLSKIGIVGSEELAN